MVLFLVGFMGSGKSSVGRRLAAALGYNFVDTDRAIEEDTGVTVSEIFAYEGEAGFRHRESELLRLLPSEGDVVVATGGGMPCYEDNLALMRERGKVIYFKLSPDRLLARLGRGRARRPKIAGMNDEELLEYITTTLPAREAWYSQADMVIDCNGATDEYIIYHIRNFLKAI